MASSPAKPGLSERQAGQIAPGRTHLYREIANQVRERIDSGEFSRGKLLPSEARLAEAYGVSRLTVKRALDLLRKEGRLDARRGLGWFVAGASVRHGLGQLSTIEADVAAMGLVPERRLLEFAFIPADETVQKLLGCESVLKTSRINLADGEPIARVTTWCSAELGQFLSMADVERSSLYDLLPTEIGKAVQVIRAVLASKDDVSLLQIPVGSACLQTERTTYNTDGQPILFAVGVFPGHRTEYFAELRREGQAQAPSVRLIPVSDEQTSEADRD